LLIKIENKKQNKFIVSERLYIGITDTINGFRSTLACCEVGSHWAVGLRAEQEDGERQCDNQLAQQDDERAVQ
jgi:hypothetical protein